MMHPAIGISESLNPACGLDETPAKAHSGLRLFLSGFQVLTNPSGFVIVRSLSWIP
jgi:hypothetical protein